MPSQYVLGSYGCGEYGAYVTRNDKVIGYQHPSIKERDKVDGHIDYAEYWKARYESNKRQAIRLLKRMMAQKRICPRIALRIYNEWEARMNETLGMFH